MVEQKTNGTNGNGKRYSFKVGTSFFVNENARVELWSGRDPVLILGYREQANYPIPMSFWYEEGYNPEEYNDEENLRRARGFRPFLIKYAQTKNAGRGWTHKHGGNRRKNEPPTHKVEVNGSSKGLSFWVYDLETGDKIASYDLSHEEIVIVLEDADYFESRVERHPKYYEAAAQAKAKAEAEAEARRIRAGAEAEARRAKLEAQAKAKEEAAPPVTGEVNGAVNTAETPAHADAETAEEQAKEPAPAAA